MENNTEQKPQLTELETKMRHATPELFTALAKAQDGAVAALKQNKNKGLGFDYANINSILEAIKDSFNKNGLSILFDFKEIPTPPKQNSRMIEVTLLVKMILTHSSGGWIVLEQTASAGNTDKAKAYGSAQTYARKYGYKNIAMIGDDDSVDPDSDAYQKNNKQANYQNKQTNYKAPAQNTPQPQTSQIKQISASQIGIINDMKNNNPQVSDKIDSLLKKVLEKNGLSNVEQMPEALATKVIDKINEKLKTLAMQAPQQQPEPTPTQSVEEDPFS